MRNRHASSRTARRRDAGAEHSRRERWLVSYADFITLLFAFFVVMYAMSSFQTARTRDATPPPGAATSGASVVLAHDASLVQRPVVVPGRVADEAERDAAHLKAQRLKALATALEAALAPIEAHGPLRVSHSPRGIAVEIGASALFSPAEARLQEEAVKVLGTAARVLAAADNAVRIEGHTDSLPIATEQFPSNWELSAARASAVARLFVDSGVAANRIGVTGFADNRPVESNQTPEGRSRNRRVTLLVLAESPDDLVSPSVSEARSQVQ